MDIKQIHYFITIARTRSMTEASKELNISSAALSLSIKNLEDELGVLLLERKHQGVDVTKAGAHFLATAKNIGKELAYLSYKITHLKKGNNLTGDFAIASVPIIARYILPLVSVKFSQFYPRVSVSTASLTPEEVLASVKQKHAQIGFINCDYESFEELGVRHDLKIIPFIKYELLVCVHRDSPLTKKRSVTLDDLSSSFIILYQDPMNSNTLIRNMLSSYGYHVGKKVELLKNPNLIEQILQKKLAVSITASVNGNVLTNLSDLSKYVYLPLENTPAFLGAYFIASNDEQRNPIADALIELLEVELGAFDE
ncbi:MAG: LysR family transcriptional regulator [Desulfitobacterium sp.]